VFAHYVRTVIVFAIGKINILLFIKVALNNFVVFHACLVKDHFPPHIYYKLFTHRPVQDVGAFAPYDYTSLEFRRKTACDVHNKMSRHRHDVQGHESSL